MTCRLHIECIRRCPSALLSHDLAGIELDKHGAIRLELFHRNREAEVIQMEELQFQMIQLDEW